MKKAIFGILLVVLVCVGLWLYYKYLHVEPPRDMYLRTVAAAMLGDEQTFLDGFTPASRPLVAGLLSLSRADEIKTSLRHPYHFLASENIEDVEIEGDTAWLRLRRMGDNTKARYDVALVKDGTSWKIDAFQFTGRERVLNKAR